MKQFFAILALGLLAGPAAQAQNFANRGEAIHETVLCNLGFGSVGRFGGAGAEATLRDGQRR